MTTPTDTKDLAAQLAALQAENAALKEKAAKSTHISCKVSDKGCLSIYGMGRFPASFYISQWDRLVENLDKIQAFVKENRSRFTVKE
jgi:hypothetical protein